MALKLEQKKAVPPSDDRRWKLVDATMRRNGYKPEALIETLHTVQEAFGFVDEEALGYITGSLHVPPSLVFGVTTFYHHFSMKPQGKHTCVVCTGTACHIKGTDQILEHIKEKYNVEVGETTPDGELSVMAARCVGACGLAPVMILDGEVVGRLDVDQMKAKLEEWLTHEQ